MARSSDICILGGNGAMGRVVVHCLASQKPRLKLTIADRMPPKKKLPAGAVFQKVDLKNQPALVRLLKKHRLVINSTSHHFNLPVMEAALKAGTHYLDLGGLFHWCRKQLKLSKKFREKNLIAVLGMGCAPGVANVMAQWAASDMDRVDEIHIKVGDRSWDPPSDAMPYAVGTIREELSLPPPIYEKGKWKFMKPMSGVEHFQFPKPVGKHRIFRTIHSETATLPLSYPGLKACSFKIGFPEGIIRAALGKPPLKKKVSSKKTLKKKRGGPRDCEMTVALVKGMRNGKKIEKLACYLVYSKGPFSAGDRDTAWPPAIVSRMILDGDVPGAGVFAPEEVVSHELLIRRMKAVGCEFRCIERR